MYEDQTFAVFSHECSTVGNLTILEMIISNVPPNVFNLLINFVYQQVDQS